MKASRDMEKRFENVGKVFKNAGTLMDGVGQGLMKTVTAPVVAVGTAATKFASESQDAFNQFAAATGATTAEMGKYRESINQIYKDNFGENINEVADGMAKVKQNMSYLDNSALERCTEYAMTLSDTFGVDISDSTRSADALIKNFGLSAREAFNLMSQGAQSGLDFSGELFDNIDEYSVQFQKLGLDANDMFSIFANGADNGAFNLDKIGDAVKEFSIRAIDGSDTTAAGFKALGMDAEDMAAKFAAGGDGAKNAFDEVIKGLASMQDPVEQNAAGVNLFGTMWEDLGPKVITSLTTTNGAIDSTKESMESLMSVKYDSLQGALGGLWRTIQTDILQPIGTMLIPYVEKGIEKVQEITKCWNSLGESTQKNVVKFALIAAAVGPVLMVFGKLTIGVGNFIMSFGKIAGAVKRFGSVIGMITSPVGIAVAAVAAIAAVAVVVYKNWDKIKPVIERVKNSVVDFVKSAGDKVNEIKDKFLNFVTYVKDSFHDGVENAINSVKDTFTGWKENIFEVVGSAIEKFTEIKTFLTDKLKTAWETVWKGMSDFVGKVFSGIVGVVKAPLNSVIGLINSAIDKINSIHISIPSIAGIGGIEWSANIPKIPQLAKGTDNWQGGIAQVHEKGGEIIDLPQGTRVYPHDESVQMARQETKKSISITIAKLADSIIVREDADIDRIAEAIAKKLEQTQLNMA